MWTIPKVCADDLTFEIAPPPHADVVEAGRDGPLPPEIEPSLD
ncbi:MAG: hypothetical protein PVS3B1_30000 [Ktedonobacteraceae bacterium]